MRLIDADALTQEWYRVNNIDEDDRGARFIGYTEIPRFIANAPTVVVDGDLISRADAIEAVEGLTKYMEKLVEGAEKFPEAHTKSYKHDMEQQIVGVAHASQVILELPSAEAVQGEWTYLSGSKGSYMTISCPICGSTFDGVAEWKYHYCPSCGSRMKGCDSE